MSGDEGITVDDFIAETEDVSENDIPETVQQRINDALERLNPDLYGAGSPDEGEPDRPVTNVNTGEKFESLGPAVSAATTGDELQVRSGETLPGSLTINVPDLTVRGHGSAPPTVTGDIRVEAVGVVLAGFAVEEGTITVAAADVAVEDAVVESGGDTGTGIVVDGNDVSLVGTTVTGFDNGVVVGDVSGVELSLNTLRDNVLGGRIDGGADSLDTVSIGKSDREPSFNIIAGNDTGIRIEDANGTVSETVETASLVRENAFENNGTNVVPTPGDPPEDTTQSATVTETETGAEIDVPSALFGGVSVDLPDLGVDEADDIRLEGLAVEGAGGATIEFDTSADAPVSEPTEAAALEIAGYFEATATPAVDSVTFDFSVARESVASPDAFSVRRFDSDTSRLVALPVERLGATSERLFYTVRSPGLSTFATASVAADPTTRTPFLLNLPDTVLKGTLEVFSGAVFLDNDTIFPPPVPVIDIPSVDDTGATTVKNAFNVTNVGFNPALVRVTVESDRVTPQAQTVVSEFLNLNTPVVLGEDQSTPVDFRIGVSEPDDQLWGRLIVPTLARSDGEEQDPVLGDEVGLDPDSIDSEFVNTIPEASSIGDLNPVCTTDRAAPIMLAKDYAAPGKTPEWVPQVSFSGFGLPRDGVPHNRVEAAFRIEQSSDIEQDIIVEIPQVAPQRGPVAKTSGRLVSIYDPDRSFDLNRPDNDDLHQPYTGAFADNADTFGFTISADELADGPVERSFELVFETVTPCPYPISDNVFDYLPDFGFVVRFADAETDRRWQDVSGQERVAARVDYHSSGKSLAKQAENVADTAMDIFAKRVIDAAFPAPVKMYGQVFRSIRAGRGFVPAAIDFANNVDGLLSNTPTTPDNILKEAIKQGVTEYDAAQGADSLPAALSAAADEVTGTGPSVYVSSDPPEPEGGITGEVVSDPKMYYEDILEPVPGVEITVEGRSETTTTNGQGAFALTLPDGEYTLTFSPPEYLSGDSRFSPVTRTVTVTEGSVTELGEVEEFVPPG